MYSYFYPFFNTVKKNMFKKTEHVLFLKKHYVCQILFLATCRSQIECLLFADYHYSARKFKLCVCIQLFTHQKCSSD